jgi:hypothetical protein
LRDRLGGIATYSAAHGLRIGIRHGRLGRLGEHARYARILLARARLAPVGVTRCRAPAPEDHLLLLATHLAYTWPAIRLGDVYGAITLLRAAPPRLDWDYLFATSLSMGVTGAVACYLSYLDALYARLFDQPLVDDRVLARFGAGAERVTGADACEAARFPQPRATALLYVQQVRAALEGGRWHSAARLSLLPVVAALAARRRRGDPGGGKPQ